MSISIGVAARIPANKGERTLRSIVVVGIPLFYAAFVFFPIVQAFLGSFHQWNPLNDRYLYSGLENYAYALHDRIFWSSMANNVIFTSVVVFFRVVIGLTLALAIAEVPRFKDLFRTIFFIPVISSLVAIAYVWKWMYDPNIGIINAALARFGLEGRNWLLDPDTALLSIIVMTVWKDSGYAVVIFLAGIMSLPREIYEAAEIDGAGRMTSFRSITWPLLNRTTVFVVITSLISYLQTFAQVFVLTAGGPGTVTYLTTYQIYAEAFVKYDFGYASSISFLLFLVIIALTVIQFRVMRDAGEAV